MGQAGSTGTLKIAPLTPAFGAEISGIDVRRLTDTQFAELFAAFTRYGVIFLRDQPELSVEQHKNFAERFGPLHVHPAARAKPTAIPEIVRIHTTEQTRVAAGNRWHSDVSCDAQPPQASVLQLHTVPPVGGDTLFASLTAAYAALSPRMQALLDGLTARHSGERPFRHLFRFDPGAGEHRWPEHDHPVVRRHVDSGRPVLFVDREFTVALNDLPKEEGQALLEFLFDHTERVDFQCRFRWTPNAIAIWDNRCVLHHAIWDYWPAERSGQRISVVGESPQPWRLGVDVEDSERSATVRLTL